MLVLRVDKRNEMCERIRIRTFMMYAVFNKTAQNYTNQTTYQLGMALNKL
jgi:hypothetical protein